MPWEHCGESILDDFPCPGCGITKEQWTLEWNVTRTFQVKSKPTIRLGLVDPQELPVEGESFRVEFPGGDPQPGRFDDNGAAKVTSPAKGEATVVFPDRHPSELRPLKPPLWEGEAEPGGDDLVRLGDEGDAVEDLQQRLCERGYPVGTDGEFGPETEGAVRWFQGDYGLIIDGVVGDETREALLADDLPDQPLPPTPPPLARDDRGSKVRKLQEALNARGADLEVDGELGPNTERALSDAQTELGLEPSGRVDAATWDALLGTEPGEGARFACHTRKKHTFRLFGPPPSTADGFHLELRTARTFPEGTALVAEGLAAPLRLTAAECHTPGRGYLFVLPEPGTACAATIEAGEASHLLFEEIDLAALLRQLDSDEEEPTFDVHWPWDLLQGAPDPEPEPDPEPLTDEIPWEPLEPEEESAEIQPEPDRDLAPVGYTLGEN